MTRLLVNLQPRQCPLDEVAVVTFGRLKVLLAAAEERLETEEMTRPDWLFCPLFLITL